MDGVASNIARRLYEAFNDRDWDRALSEVSDGVEATVVPFGMTTTGREGFAQFMQGWVAMSSDLRVEIVDQHETERGVVNEIVATGTHDGPFTTPSGELPPSGRPIEVPAVEVWEVTAGKVTKLRNHVDVSTLWQQITAPQRVEERIRGFYEQVANNNRLDLIPEYATEDWLDHESFGEIPATRDGIGQFLTMFRDAFPDLHFTVDEVLVAGDKVTTRIRISGTHKGEFMGIPPTGKSFEIETIDILRMVGDRAAEHWGVTDAMGMMSQLGVSEGVPA